MAHTASVRQLHSLLRINSFSCPQIAPRIDWFYLPAFLGRAWKQEKSVAPRLPSHLFIISSPCFHPLSAKLLFIFLCLVPALPAEGCCLRHPYRGTQTRAHGSPCRDSSEEPAGREEGHCQNTKRSQLPDSSGSITGSPESRKKSSCSNFVILSGFAKF